MKLVISNFQFLALEGAKIAPNACTLFRGTGEQRQYWRTGNKKHFFDFWGTGEQVKFI